MTGIITIPVTKTVKSTPTKQTVLYYNITKKIAFKYLINTIITKLLFFKSKYSILK